jgi:hypothetical protein
VRGYSHLVIREGFQTFRQSAQLQRSSSAAQVTREGLQKAKKTALSFLAMGSLRATLTCFPEGSGDGPYPMAHLRKIKRRTTREEKTLLIILFKPAPFGSNECIASF